MPQEMDLALCGTARENDSGDMAPHRALFYTLLCALWKWPGAQS